MKIRENGEPFGQYFKQTNKVCILWFDDPITMLEPMSEQYISHHIYIVEMCLAFNEFHHYKNPKIRAISSI